MCLPFTFLPASVWQGRTCVGSLHFVNKKQTELSCNWEKTSQGVSGMGHKIIPKSGLIGPYRLTQKCIEHAFSILILFFLQLGFKRLSFRLYPGYHFVYQLPIIKQQSRNDLWACRGWCIISECTPADNNKAYPNFQNATSRWALKTDEFQIEISKPQRATPTAPPRITPDWTMKTELARGATQPFLPKTWTSISR